MTVESNESHQVCLIDIESGTNDTDHVADVNTNEKDILPGEDEKVRFYED